MEVATLPILPVNGAKFFGVAAKGRFWDASGITLKCQMGEGLFLGG